MHVIATSIFFLELLATNEVGFKIYVILSFHCQLVGNYQRL